MKPAVAPAAAIAIESAPFTGRVLPSSASSPTIAYCSNNSLLNCPLPARMPTAIGKIERPGALRQLGRCQVDHDAILRPHEAAVDHRPLDAMRALLHRLLGQSDEQRLRQRAGRDIDFDLDRQSVDTEERKGVELGEHGR